MFDALRVVSLAVRRVSVLEVEIVLWLDEDFSGKVTPVLSGVRRSSIISACTGCLLLVELGYEGQRERGARAFR